MDDDDDDDNNKQSNFNLLVGTYLLSEQYIKIEDNEV